MGVFHPNFAPIHQQAALLLGQENVLICKGEGGEFERIPDRTVELYGASAGTAWRETWETLIKPGGEVKPERLNLNHFRAVWDGEAEDRYGELAVTGTLALVIRALGIVTGSEEAQRMAVAWWRQRHVADWAQEAV